MNLASTFYQLEQRSRRDFEGSRVASNVNEMKNVNDDVIIIL